MTILALDTTSEFGSVAVRLEGKTAAQTVIYSSQGFGHLIFEGIEAVLKQAGVGLSEIDCFAAASGPGSFTGVRIGLSAVKGLAEAMNKSAVGISNLKAMSSFGSLPLRAVALDARRGEVYAAVYNSDLQPVGGEAVLKLSAWLDRLGEAGYQFIGSISLEGTRFSGMPRIEPPRSLAEAIGYCAERSEWQDPAALDANYVRRSDAELFWKED